MNQRFALDLIKLKYDRDIFLESDPIQFCYEFENREDIEIVGFVSAVFSYGNVQSIVKFLKMLFSYLGKSPFLFLKSKSVSEKHFPNIKYRFQTRQDIILFLITLQEIFQDMNSLETLFGEENNSTDKRIILFQKRFHDYSRIISKKKLSSGLKFLIGSGIETSSNKRYNMFLRWMTRKNFPDFGLYKTFDPKNLLYPVDVHISKFSRVLGFTKYKSINLKFAKDITEHVKNFNEEDPLAYDFSLSRLGILRQCKMKYVSEICESCELNSICKIYALSTSRRLLDV